LVIDDRVGRKVPAIPGMTEMRMLLANDIHFG